LPLLANNHQEDTMSIAPGNDMPQSPPEARRLGIEDVLAHWNSGYIPVYGIPVHLILGLREGLVLERDDEACGLPHEPAPRPIARRLRALFRRGGLEALR
jgi:hypothetical protein